MPTQDSRLFGRENFSGDQYGYMNALGWKPAAWISLYWTESFCCVEKIQSQPSATQMKPLTRPATSCLRLSIYSIQNWEEEISAVYHLFVLGYFLIANQTKEIIKTFEFFSCVIITCMIFCFLPLIFATCLIQMSTFSTSPYSS